MAKVALLIGVSEYESGLNPLPGTQKDIEAMQRVLQHPEIGGFDEVRLLTNPEPQTMRVAIQTLFSGRQKDDLLLLYFSGHGLLDERGKLYMTSCKTLKNLVESTAVDASFVHGIMSKSRSKRQIVILDCCYGGAFAEGLSARGDGSLDIKAQLGGEGRAVLTSCTVSQISLEQEESGIYTRYLIEGIETGAADTDEDGFVSIDELHNYAKKKVQEASPAMTPEIYAVREGYKIKLAKAPVGDPKLKYRKEVEELVYEDNGEVSFISRCILDELRDRLGVLQEEATAIEDEVFKPFREKQKKLQRYQQVFSKVVQEEYPLSELNSNKLKRLQKILQLRDEDITPITEIIITQITLNPALRINIDSKKKITSKQSLTDDFSQMQFWLVSILKLLRQFLNKLKLINSITPIDQVIKRAESQSFSIAVVGEFKRGKSTFINALLGKEILPTDIEPCSAALSRITYGEIPSVRVLFKDGREEEIAIEQMANYVTKLTPESEITAAKLKEAVVYLPTDYCQNNVDIIDVPGQSDDPKMTEVTLSVLSQVDAVIMVMMAQAPFSQLERDFLLNTLLPSDVGRVIFVVTGIDRCNRSGDADKIIRSLEKRIKACVLDLAEQQWGLNSAENEAYWKKIAEARVFGLSSFQALEAKLNCDDTLLIQSRFPEFEAALKKFIVTERRIIRLQVAVNRAIISAKKILETISTQEKALEMNQEEINEMRVETRRMINNMQNLSGQLISGQ